jgi:hypothetical protein
LKHADLHLLGHILGLDVAHRARQAADVLAAAARCDRRELYRLASLAALRCSMLRRCSL